MIVGTAAALISEVKATADGRMVQRSKAATINITVTAFLGSLFAET